MATKDEVLRAMADSDDDQLGIERIRQMLRAADALGWRMAPVEATPEMVSAGHHSDPLGCDVEEEHAQDVYSREWRAMLSASPSLIDE